MARIGLVLSGGMMKGAYQVGVLEALGKYVDLGQIRSISAASIGVLNAYAYASGKLEMARKLWDQAADTTNSKGIGALIKDGYLENAIHEIVEEYPLPVRSLYFPLYDLKRNRLQYMDLTEVSEETVEEYLKAAVTMPFLNRPIRIGQSSYYDGAMIDNIPIRPLIGKELDYIICVYFDNCNYIFENASLDQRVIKVIFYDPTHLKNSLYADRTQIHTMLEEGYRKGDLLFGRLMESGPDEVEEIFRRNQVMRRTILSEKRRITGDVIVNNLNRVARKLVREKEGMR